MEEIILQEDMEVIKETRNKLNILKMQMKIAELEANNAVLALFNKYGLKMGVDSVLENGKIVRAVPVVEEVKE